MKKLPILFFSLLFLTVSTKLTAQNVGIGTNNPLPSAALDIESNGGGVLIPQLTEVQMTGIPNPAPGLLVYNKDSFCFFFYTMANGWKSLCGGGGGGTTNTPTYNTAVNFNPATDSLSVTDGGGSISAYIPKPGRWYVTGRGQQDISTTSGNYTPMTSMKVSFTPTKNVVFVSASAAGDLNLAPTLGTLAAVGLEVKDSATNTTVVGSDALASGSYVNADPGPYTPQVTSATTSNSIVGILSGFGFGTAQGTGWSMSMCTAYPVTPGVPVTLELEWQVQWADPTLTGSATCNTTTDPTHANRNLIVWE